MNHSSSRIAAGFLAALCLAFAQFDARAQGTIHFRVTISGSEIAYGQKSPVVGGGTLALSGSTLSYDITVPIRLFPPVETHFHGPAVNGEVPIFSVGPYQQFGTSVRFTGSREFDPKWLPDIRAGKWYVNLHNVNYDNAVLSGFIIPVVPEPGPLALMAAGLVFFRACRPRRREFQLTSP